MKKKARNHRVSTAVRPPSPIKPSPNKQILTYAQAQRMVEFEIDGHIHRLSVFDRLAVISDGDPASREMLESANNKENADKPQQQVLLRSVRLKNNREKRKAALGITAKKGGGGHPVTSNPGPKLPEPKFRTVEYNLPAVPKRHSSYYKYEEKTEEELDEETEYDMDEEDYAWLDLVNEKRRSEGASQVSFNVFEFLVDRFEKELYLEGLDKGSEKLASVDEDTVCCICMDGECHNSNAILFCDVCNVAVHQECYGVPYIPEGQWLCRHCLQSPAQPADCILCPSKGGAVKKTEDGRWGHVVCALWVPEVGFSNTTFIEPIDGVRHIPPARWKLTCYLCKEKGVGVCIQCHKANCYTAFHVSCAQKAGLFMKMEPVKDLTESGEPTLSLKKTAYCGAHTPNGCVRRKLAIYDQAKPKNGLWNKMDKGRGAAQCKGKHKKKTKKPESDVESEAPSPAAVPTFPSHRLQTILNQVSVQKKKAFVELVLNYWTLKRQSRNGLPLIRRLHTNQQSHKNAQPVCSSKQNEEETRALKEQLKERHRLRHDLERARLLLELIRKREKLKREELKFQESLLEMQLTPFNILLRAVLDQLLTKDQARIFTQPVDVNEVPDYLDHIKRPMDFSTMRQRLDAQKYSNFDQFEEDFDLIVDNCMKYNSKDTYFYRAAVRLRDQGGAVIRKARRDAEKIGFDAASGMHLDEAPRLKKSSFSWEDVDRLLAPANRSHLPLDKQLQQLLEKFDLTCAMKSSPSRSKRIKLLKKTINDVRSDMSLKRVQPSQHHHHHHHHHHHRISSSFSAAPSSAPSASSAEVAAKLKEERWKPNGHFPDDEDKSLPPKLEPSDAIPPLIHSDTDPEPPTLKPIDATQDCDDKTLANGMTFVGDRANPPPSPPHLNGHSHDNLADSLFEGDVSVVATSTLAEPAAAVNRRTAVLFCKSKAASPCKAAKGRDDDDDDGGDDICGAATEQKESEEEADGDNTQLASKSFLSVVIPRLETLLHSKKRKRLDSHEEREEDGESPVKRLDMGLSRGFLEVEEEKALGQPSRAMEPRRRCASESSISSCSSLPGGPGTILSLPKCGKGKPALLRRNTVDDKNELIACIENGNFAKAARIAAEVGNSNIWMPASAATVALEPLKLVWAKCSGYPSYPALIIDPHMPRVGCQHNGVSIPMPPMDVLRIGEQMQYKADEKLYLVLFFDTKRSWQWLPRSKMVPLGMDKTIDKIKMMEGRTSSVRKAVQVAYSRAMNHLSIVRDEPVSDLSDVD
ncbi:bromodomain-containing protein 1 isoform X1 [Hippocampus comes]|uniref:bromodomain-containing protein 1 isoform X1 n=1 Tax=Hippocampus comes TaxID=109280 RepID=UPI00094E9265|nr:PREDICTED: bromodomain-containing protein 1 isoform X1 [Hippocampus comes]XP_019738431.1 PREDICTED: bromodomain-containing protein 1 isoform X1 [Hippocampus comes]XP_019738442.1 PREDICTED: bromodomain-containing protein 1 isoform X1 [Hippocampus comes]XP_019738460.1 PREDICTED: bromodomain-containing protein 1 isoform X1 [Hippocampus comes]